MKLFQQGAIIAAIITLAGSANAQLRFTGARATEEGAIILNWQSESNTVYRIDYAGQLQDVSQGGPVWQTLYDQYPSHGTNTFWLDTGNYFVENPIPHPKYTTARFYRIVNEGTNSGAAPSVAITSPSSGATLSGSVTVSVAAGTSYPLVSTKLYVDGQEMYQSDDGTNYTFNTCEWPNGPHVLFATAQAESNFDGPNGTWPIAVGRAVSAYVPVTFSNLITKIAFNQAFFEPSLGQTQQVTATFAANVNWTLQIVDENSNALRTVTGSGGSMLFNWDGTGNSGQAIPDGLYHYSISAQTNGQALIIQPPSGGGGSPPVPGMSSSPETMPNADEPYPNSAWQAIGAGLDYYFHLPPPMPPVRTNGQWVAWEDVYGPEQPMRIEIPEAACERLLGSLLANSVSVQAVLNSPSPNGPSPLGYSGPSSQAATAPTRPAVSPVKGKAGDYSIGAYSYPNTNTWPVPTYGSWPLVVQVALEGNSQPMTFDPIPPILNQIGHVCQTMTKLGWKLAHERHDDMLPVNSMRRADLGIGGGEFFTDATIGLFIGHGTYETKPDLAPGASAALLTVWPSSNPNDASSPWLRMCQFGFGGNLKWMAILACNSLCDPNYGSMASVGAIPLKETHLVCGTASIAAVGENIGSNWAVNMIKKKQKVADAWFAAGRKEYAGATNLNAVTFRVAGYPDCIDDTIQNTNTPANPNPAPRNLVKRDSPVFP